MSELDGRYDPNSPEGAQRGSGYITGRDIKVLTIGLLAFAIILLPVYRYGKQQSEKVRCQANLKAMYDAISLYATEKDDRFPPVYQPLEDLITPQLTADGRAMTFASDTASYMNKRHDLVCPAAAPEENSRTVTDDAERSLLSYGMYMPFSGLPRSSAPSDESLLLAETSNHGSAGSYNPLPFPNTKQDGFVVGWSNSNHDPSQKPNAVTRLAFRGTSAGNFDSPEAVGRHGEAGIYFVTASGTLVMLTPPAAKIRNGEYGPKGPWEIPLGYRPPR